MFGVGVPFFPASVNDLAAVEDALRRGDDVVVRFGRTAAYPTPVLGAVNQLCAEYGGRVRVQFYDHSAGGGFSGSVLRHLPAVEDLAIVGMGRASDLRALWELPDLRWLDLGVQKLSDPDLLASDNLRQLVSLEISQWGGSRPLDLAPIGDMAALEMLRLAKPVRNVEALTRLPELKTLWLHGVQVDPLLDYVAAIPGLRQLMVMSGTRTDLEGMQHPSVEKLHVQDVRGLVRLDVTGFPNLADLSVHFQARLTDLACSGANARLARVVVLRCARLARFRGLRELPALQNLAVAECPVTAEELLAG